MYAYQFSIDKWHTFVRLLTTAGIFKVLLLAWPN